jgi:hypothetical protein
MKSHPHLDPIVVVHVWVKVIDQDPTFLSRQLAWIVRRS